MKRHTFVKLITLLSVFSISSCQGTPVVSDNSNAFEWAELSYKKIKDNDYSFDNYKEVKDEEKTKWALYVYNRVHKNLGTDLEELSYEEFDDYSIELPFKIDVSKKYVLDEFSDIALDIGIVPTYDDIMYASEQFTKTFDEFLKEETFKGKISSENDLVLYKVKTEDTTYYLFDDGYVGKEFSNGIYRSTSVFPLYISLIEYYSIRTYRGSGIEFAMQNGVAYDVFFTLSYNNKTLTMHDFSEYFKDDNKSPYSFLVNEKKFDYSQMIDFSYSYGEDEVTYHHYLSRDGLIFADLNYIASFAWVKAFFISPVEENYIAYAIVHSGIDAEAIFKLFE